MAYARCFTISSFHPLCLSQKPIRFPSLPISSFSFTSRRGFRSSLSILPIPKTYSSSSSQFIDSGDFDIVSAEEKSDGSLVFQFGEASEISMSVEKGKKSVFRPKTGEIEITGVELVTCSKEEVNSRKELVDSVRLIDVSTKDRTFSEDDFEDFRPSSGKGVVQMINFKVVSPVNKSKHENVVKDEINGGNGNFTSETISPDVASFKEVALEEGENDVASELSELEIEIPATLASEAGMKKNFEVQELDLSTKKTASSYNSIEESEILNERPANLALDEEHSKAPAHYAWHEKLAEDTLDNKLIHDALDEEPVEEPNLHILDVEPVEQQTHHIVDEEPVYQLTDKEVAEQPTPNALDEESVVSEGVETINMVINCVMNEQPTDVAAVEETVQQKIQTTVPDDEPPVGNETVEILEVFDEKLPSSKSAEEITQSSYGDVSIPLAAGLQLSNAVMTMEGNSIPTIFLTSGAASLPHPSKALIGRKDAYFVHENWLGIADGVGLWSLEGISDGKYAQELMKNCEKTVADNRNIPITEPVEVLHKASTETLSPGSSTALTSNFDGQALHVAPIGDSGFLIIRNGTIFKKSSPMVHEFNFPVQIEKGDNPSKLVEEYNINLDEGDIIVTGTDGLFDNLYDQEIASIVCSSLEAGMNLQEIAELLAESAQKVGQSKSVRSPFADEAHAAGYVGYTGGRLDDVTVILSVVHQTSTHL